MGERRTACDILLRVEKGGYSNLLLATRETTPFITAVVYGTLEKRVAIDEVLLPFLKGGFKKMDAEVITILRMSAYQLLYMKTSADYAVINEGVKLCKAYKKSSATGLVNAVLRKVKNAEIPNTETARFSLHSEIIARLKNDYPNSYEEIAENTLKRPQLCIYPNLNRTTREKLAELLEKQGIETTEGIADNTLFCKGSQPLKGNHKPLQGNSRLLQGGEAPTQTECFKQGLFHVIGSCSALTAQGVLSFKPKNILDLCAAPGGKTAIMAMSAEKVTACDVSENRLSAMKSQLARLNLENVECIVNDAAISVPSGEFDAVLCDVPCSASGVMSRKPELRHSPPRTEELCKTQQKILQNAASAVKVGGVLCYSTCSLFRDENERQIERFLAENKGFEPICLPFDAPEFCEVREKNITFFPDNKKIDGFFMAFLRKVW